MTDSTSPRTTPTNGGRRSPHAAAIAAVVLLVVGVVALTLGFRGSDGPPQPSADAAGSVATSAPSTTPRTATSSPTRTSSPSRSTSSGPVAPPATTITNRFLPASKPVSIDVSGVDIHSTSFVPLTLAKDGTITVPGTADEVGLYAGGPSPGQLGPAVLAAHVDSTKGPGVFYRLGGTKVGDTIKIGRADGKTAVFTVDRVSVFPKDQFPTAAVYTDGYDQASIRLVTCGGTFDKVKHYLSNVVVFGHLTSVQ